MKGEVFCARCGALDPTRPCGVCGYAQTTGAPPSQEPCAYCGARPTWPVEWDDGRGAWTVYLCAACDDAEISAMEEEVEG